MLSGASTIRTDAGISAMRVCQRSIANIAPAKCARIQLRSFERVASEQERSRSNHRIIERLIFPAALLVKMPIFDVSKTAEGPTTKASCLSDDLSIRLLFLRLDTKNVVGFIWQDDLIETVSDLRW